jgi:hypothetical protein
MKPEMIVPDDLRAYILSFGLDPDLLLDLWEVIANYIPANFQKLRQNRPGDIFHEGFFFSRSIRRGDVSHVFSVFVDDSSATDRLFLRDIQYETHQH